MVPLAVPTDEAAALLRAKRGRTKRRDGRDTESGGMPCGSERPDTAPPQRGRATPFALHRNEDPQRGAEAVAEGVEASRGSGGKPLRGVPLARRFHGNDQYVFIWKQMKLGDQYHVFPTMNVPIWGAYAH